MEFGEWDLAIVVLGTIKITQRADYFMFFARVVRAVTESIPPLKRTTTRLLSEPIKAVWRCRPEQVCLELDIALRFELGNYRVIETGRARQYFAGDTPLPRRPKFDSPLLLCRLQCCGMRSDILQKISDQPTPPQQRNQL